MSVVTCPRCRSELRAAHPWNVPVEECPACRGVWFERSTLLTYLRAADTRTSSQARRGPKFFTDEQGTALQCPRCGSHTLVPGFSSSLFLHRCSRCSGVFIAGSELRSLRPRSAAIGSPEAQALGNVLAAPVAIHSALDILDLLASILDWP